MSQPLDSAQIEVIKGISVAAGIAIMDVYQKDDFNIQHKDDQSPLTAADLAAHKVISQKLAKHFPDIPQLSEEDANISFNTRNQWQQYWCIDPLDGTKEFINRNDDFTVNIALIEQGHTVFGVIYVPVTGELYWGGKNYGAHKQRLKEPAKIINSRALGTKLTIIASRRHGQDKNSHILKPILHNYTTIEQLSRGSSLKMCMIAEGKADIYPRLFPTSEWDTAAAQAIVEGAGGMLVDAKQLQPLRYNQKDSLINPYFLVVGDKNFPLTKLNLTATIS